MTSSSRASARLAPALDWPSAARDPGWSPISPRPSAPGSRRRRRPVGPRSRPGPGRDRDGRGARPGVRWSSRWWRCSSSPRSPGRSASACPACGSSSVGRRRARRSVRRRASTQVDRRPPGRRARRCRSANESSSPISTIEPGSTSRGPRTPRSGPRTRPTSTRARAGRCRSSGPRRLPCRRRSSRASASSSRSSAVTSTRASSRRWSGANTTVELVRVSAGPGYWLSGDPHFLFWRGPDGVVTEERRWVGDALLWWDGGITFRLESALGRDMALRLADSMH